MLRYQIKKLEIFTALVDLSIEDQEEDTSWVDCSKELAITSFPNFNELRLSGQLCDVSIDVDDGCVFRAHKAVLAATIPFFQVMFTTDMMESRSSTIKITRKRHLCFSAKRKWITFK